MQPQTTEQKLPEKQHNPSEPQKHGVSGFISLFFEITFYFLFGALFLKYTMNEENYGDPKQCLILQKWGNFYGRFNIAAGGLYMFIGIPYQIMIYKKPIQQVNDYKGGKKYFKLFRNTLLNIINIFEIVLVIGITYAYNEEEPCGKLIDFSKAFLIVRWIMFAIKIIILLLYTFAGVGFVLNIDKPNERYSNQHEQKTGVQILKNSDTEQQNLAVKDQTHQAKQIETEQKINQNVDTNIHEFIIDQLNDELRNDKVAPIKSKKSVPIVKPVVQIEEEYAIPQEK